MSTQTVLSCSNISVHFGGVIALDGVDLNVTRGNIQAVIGPNGAGKTTLLNAITGMVHTNSGSITLGDKDMTGLQPHKRGQAGLVRSFQNLEVFSNMTVLENVMTGAHRRFKYSFLDALLRTPRYFSKERQCRKLALEMLDFVGLADTAHLDATALAYGNQRLMEMARAIASAPEVLLLDEPAAGLNNKETRQLATVIRRMRDELGITILLVEHDMELIMDISDEIFVMYFGRELAQGTPAEIQNNPEVVAAYLGEDDDEPMTPCEEDDVC